MKINQSVVIFAALLVALAGLLNAADQPPEYPVKKAGRGSSTRMDGQTSLHRFQAHCNWEMSGYSACLSAARCGGRRPAVLRFRRPSNHSIAGDAHEVRPPTFRLPVVGSRSSFVPPNQRRVEVKIVGYSDESDEGPFPVPDNMPIEGWPVGYQDKQVSLDDVQRDRFGKGARG